MKEDTGTQDTPYTEVSARLSSQERGFLGFLNVLPDVQDTLVEQLKLCVDYLWKSERYELIADINKPVIAVFEKRRDFKVSSNLRVHVKAPDFCFLSVRLCVCRGCRSCTTTSIAPTSK